MKITALDAKQQSINYSKNKDIGLNLFLCLNMVLSNVFRSYHLIEFWRPKEKNDEQWSTKHYTEHGLTIIEGKKNIWYQ